MSMNNVGNAVAALVSPAERIVETRLLWRMVALLALAGLVVVGARRRRAAR